MALKVGRRRLGQILVLIVLVQAVVIIKGAELATSVERNEVLKVPPLGADGLEDEGDDRLVVDCQDNFTGRQEVFARLEANRVSRTQDFGYHCTQHGLGTKFPLHDEFRCIDLLVDEKSVCDRDS